MLLSEALDLLHNARFELHRAESVDLAIDVMVSDAINEANIAHLGPNLDRSGTALHLEVLDDADRVTVVQDIADSVLDHRFDSLCLRLVHPFVSALWTHQQRTHLVGVFAGAGRAGRKGISHPPRIVGELYFFAAVAATDPHFAGGVS